MIYSGIVIFLKSASKRETKNSDWENYQSLATMTSNLLEMSDISSLFQWSIKDFTLLGPNASALALILRWISVC